MKKLPLNCYFFGLFCPGFCSNEAVWEITDQASWKLLYRRTVGTTRLPVNLVRTCAQKSVLNKLRAATQNTMKPLNLSSRLGLFRSHEVTTSRRIPRRSTLV